MPTETTDFLSAPQKLRTEEGQRKRKEKRRKLLITKLWSDFARNTGLHGLRYTAEDGLSIVEKVFWVVIFAVSVGLCAVLINNVWIKWNTSPVIVSFNERVVPVGKVPFPSVTICPQTKSRISDFNFTQYMEKVKKSDEDTLPELERLTKNETKTEKSIDINALDDDEKAELLKGDDIALVCLNPDDDDIYGPVINRTHGNVSIINHLIEVAPTTYETFVACSWQSKAVNCDDIFNRVITSEGICYNFNALAAEEIFNENVQKDYLYMNTTNKTKNWNILDGYSNSEQDSYPRRASENGATPDLVVFLCEEDDERDELCNGMNTGFKVYVQHPADVPQSSLYYFAALRNQVSSLALKFSMITTSDNLKNYPADVRQCYFPNDRHLRYFKTYTANNCLLECRANYTFEKCGCVGFHMPHNDSDHICTQQSQACVVNAQDELSLMDEGEGAGACKCYPDCHSITYDAEVLKTQFNIQNYLKTVMRLHGADMNSDEMLTFSKLEFYFKQPRFLSMQRSELFGATDFLANIGGLLGLFLGFSFISLIEIIYFMSLRFCCEVKRDAKKEEEEITDSDEKIKLKQ